MMEFENQVICGDSLEVLKELPSNHFKAVITDPPYFIGFASSAKDNGGRQDLGNSTMLNPLFDAIFTEIKRVLRPDGVMLMFTDWRTYPVLYNRLSRYMDIKNLIVWDFKWIKAGTHFRFSHELIVYATMPEAKGPEDRTVRDVWDFKPINFTVERNHPAEKPVEIMEYAIKHLTQPGDAVLDCFAGSGPVGVAAKRLNRRFTLIEINEDHVKTCERRLADTARETSLQAVGVGLAAWNE
jgi:site-specific DNA-methyltransferase (adenine-specific)